MTRIGRLSRFQLAIFFLIIGCIFPAKKVRRMADFTRSITPSIKDTSNHPINGSTILITGGTGSFGRHFARHILTHYSPEKVIIFSRDELKQWQMREEDTSGIFQSSKVRFFLGDIRDKERLKLALHDVQFVVHAAALKQVPAAEYNPTEFINTNVIGAMNLTQAALETGVEKVIALSTDKAVNPINLYGATKLCSDKLFIAANAYAGKRGYPLFSCVRYGNVLGSRGSLLPSWKARIARGDTTLPITDMEMTRFWISLDEAVSLVLLALAGQAGAEVFIPKCYSVKVKDLAAALFPQAKLEITGVRPGEKIHEILISSDDARYTYEFEDHYRILPAFKVHKPERVERCLQSAIGHVADGFSLSSDKNPLFITDLEEIRKLIKRSGNEN